MKTECAHLSPCFENRTGPSNRTRIRLRFEHNQVVFTETRAGFCSLGGFDGHAIECTDHTSFRSSDIILDEILQGHSFRHGWLLQATGARKLS
jgi:hypothetical protein